ncbi:MAG: protein YgfX [Moraxellaceae bacterium]
MSSFSPVWRIDLKLRPSRISQGILLLLHLAAALAVLQAGLSLRLQILLWLVITLLAVLGLRQEQRRQYIVREQGSDWWLETAARMGHAELVSSQVWRFLVVMDFRAQDERGIWRQRVVVLPDAVVPDAFRRLRVRLRHGALPASKKTL